MLPHAVDFHSGWHFLGFSLTLLFGSFLIFLLCLSFRHAHSEILHFESHILLDLLQGFGVDELSEWIEFTLIEQSQEVVAEPAHL